MNECVHYTRRRKTHFVDAEDDEMGKCMLRRRLGLEVTLCATVAHMQMIMMR